VVDRSLTERSADLDECAQIVDRDHLTIVICQRRAYRRDPFR
jgi:hypothetical protein